MTFDELKFKAEDFEEKVEFAYRTRAAQQLAQVITNEANRLLEEKLKRAPEVFCLFEDDSPYSITHDDSLADTRSHRARLVCIEEIGK